jgi:tetratricopeptide (TPR) repeat protein
MLVAGQLDMKDLNDEEEDAVTIFMRAKLLERERKFEQAIDEFAKVIELDPNFINAAYSKAACENLIGRFE